MKIVGIDPGITTGMCLYDDEVGSVVTQEIKAEVGKGADWWTFGCDAGIEVGMAVERWIGSGVSSLVVMEDFVLSPTKVRAGTGGRNAVVSVLVGGICWQMIGDLVPDARRMVSMPSGKNAVGKGMLGALWEEHSGPSSIHCKDAHAHAVLGSRQR